MFKIVEKIFTVMMLFYATAAVLPQVLGAGTGLSRSEGSPLALAVQTALYSAAFFFIVLGWRSFLHWTWGVKWIVALSLLAVASVAWSQDPVFTLRRSIVLIATTAFGIYFGNRYTLAEQLRLLAWTCALVVLSCFVYGVFLPEYGIDHVIHPGDWQGAFIQKNSLARAMVLSILVFYFVRPAAGGWLRWVGMTGSFALLVLSRSVTGVVVLALATALLPLFSLLRRKLSILIPMGIILAALAVGVVLLLVTYGGDLLLLLHRSPTLTDRTELWQAVLMSISKHPWSGYGFNAFWMGMQGESAALMLRVGWFPKHAHNGCLDLLLDLGIVGLGTFLAGYVSLWSKVGRLLRSAAGPYPMWLCAYLAFMFIYNLTESSILVQNNLFWILYVSAASTLAALFPEKSRYSQAVSQYEFQFHNYSLQG